MSLRNTSNTTAPPVVMVLAGHDPSGGAGIQADIEAIASLGAYPVTVITALTAQDSRNVQRVTPVEATGLIEQARMMLEDMPIAAFKLGLLGDTAIIEAVHSILRDYPDIPVVFDPVLAAGGGTTLSTEAMVDCLQHLILPMTTLTTPNTQEAQKLAPEADTLAACAQEIIANGCRNVLITGTHNRTPDVVNILYGSQGEMRRDRWPRLPDSYHGSGCTLASAIAAGLAHGIDLPNAVETAQRYTWKSLKHARRLGMGQMLPNRLYWACEDKAAHHSNSGS